MLFHIKSAINLMKKLIKSQRKDKFNIRVARKLTK